ncbi:hypothetical protein [Georgenia deserti]|uniref:Uncharacterized protein n=1 Tax=Georgenia deserti TaxID=2093781 RepID=A0ABW4L9H6_9MICO
MILLRRTARPPHEIRAHLPHGRVHAATELADGAWAFVTTDRLLVASDDGVTADHPWHTVEQGRWDGGARTVTVTWVDGRAEPLVLRTATDDVVGFTSALRERVQSSVVHTEAGRLPNGTWVHVFVRREESGELLSQVQARGPLRGDTEEQRIIDELEHRTRAAVGLPT